MCCLSFRAPLPKKPPLVQGKTYSYEKVSLDQANDFFLTTSQTSVDDFNHFLSDVENIHFVSKYKQQNSSVSIHKIHLIPKDTDLRQLRIHDPEEALLIKRANTEGRKQKSIGFGAHKFFQEAVLLRKETPPLKVALSTYEQNILADDDAEILSLRFRQKPELRDAIHYGIKGMKSGKVHTKGLCPATMGKKSLHKLPKLIEILPICKDAYTLKDQKIGDKIPCILGLLRSLQVLIKQNIIHQDIKAKNVGFNGVFLDIGSFIDCNSESFCAETLDSYGTMGIHALIQEFPTKNTSNISPIDIKKMQDSTSTAKLIYFLMTKEVLDTTPPEPIILHSKKCILIKQDSSSFEEKLAQFRQKINHLQTNPWFNNETKKNLQELLLDMTGTNDVGNYKDGICLIGDALYTRIALFLENDFSINNPVIISI